MNQKLSLIIIISSLLLNIILAILLVNSLSADRDLLLVNITSLNEREEALFELVEDEEIKDLFFDIELFIIWEEFENIPAPLMQLQTKLETENSQSVEMVPLLLELLAEEEYEAFSVIFYGFMNGYLLSFTDGFIEDDEFVVLNSGEEFEV